tara:strand:+ start:552 stop:767 length:216 start_codon:yes stop_codon:yes gene_type:complete
MESPKVGDILIDCHGNKMVVVDLLKHGECYVLLNGRVKLVNPMGSSIVKKEASNNFQHRNLKEGRVVENGK